MSYDNLTLVIRCQNFLNHGQRFGFNLNAFDPYRPCSVDLMSGFAIPHTECSPSNRTEESMFIARGIQQRV